MFFTLKLHGYNIEFLKCKKIINFVLNAYKFHNESSLVRLQIIYFFYSINIILECTAIYSLR